MKLCLQHSNQKGSVIEIPFHYGIKCSFISIGKNSVVPRCPSSLFPVSRSSTFVPNIEKSYFTESSLRDFHHVLVSKALLQNPSNFTLLNGNKSFGSYHPQLFSPQSYI